MIWFGAYVTQSGVPSHPDMYRDSYWKSTRYQPRLTGRKVEVAMKQIISGKQVRISSTVVNPEALRGYARFVDLEAQEPSKL